MSVSVQARALAWLTRRTVKNVMSGQMNLAAARATLTARAKYPAFLPRELTVAAVANGLVRGEWLEPASAVPGRTILYLHGGGYFAGSPATHRPLTARLAARARARVFSLDYRLAPEHPYPAALDDARAAVRWLVGSGVDPRSLAIAGDSAGGGLSLATLLALRDAGEPLPACAALLSPWTDLAGTGDSTRTNAETDVMISAQGMPPVARLYHGATSVTDPYVSPLYGSFDGLPPLLFQVTDTEILFDDSRRVAEKARAAGVQVTVEVWPGLQHVWQIAVPFVPEANRAMAKIAEFVASATSGR